MKKTFIEYWNEMSEKTDGKLEPKKKEKAIVDDESWEKLIEFFKKNKNKSLRMGAYSDPMITHYRNIKIINSNEDSITYSTSISLSSNSEEKKTLERSRIKKIVFENGEKMGIDYEVKIIFKSNAISFFYRNTK